MLVSINPENLLLEGARRIDEWSLIEKKIPSLDLIFKLERAAAELAAAELTPEQRKLLPLLDGRHTVTEIVEESGLVEFDVGKAVFGLLQAGFARQVGPGGRPRTAGAGRAHRRAPQPRHRLLQDGDVRGGRPRVPRVVELQPTNLESRFYLGLIEPAPGRRPRRVARFPRGGGARRRARRRLPQPGALARTARPARRRATRARGGAAPGAGPRGLIRCRSDRPGSSSAARPTPRRARALPPS
jgi:hypothetical protein